jgi:D-amino-acid dehydrogenase
VKILIIGSGLSGVTAAYALRCRGHEVTVIEREQGPARETSFANAALLTPSMAGPWNAPGCWRVLLASLGRSDSAMQLRLKALPGLTSWGVTFLRNSRTATFERNMLSNLRLAQDSLRLMSSLRQRVHLEYGRAARGTLSIFRDRPALDRAIAAANRLLPAGVTFRSLSREESVELEPGLAPIADQLVGAIHYGNDETGDAYRFCVALAEQARRQGVEFRFRSEVSSLEVRLGRVLAAVSERERLVADRYIVAAGSYSTPLLRRSGVHLPVRPVKGYSVTFDCPTEQDLLRIPVVDDELHAVVVPLNGVTRVAGTAEFAGFDRTLNPARVRNLVGLLRKLLPQAHFDPATARPWCGLRAMSADGVPLIGFTAVDNLLVNTGHGHLGWTMAAGSAQLLADLVSGEVPSVDPAPYDPRRFCRARP